jgi:UDP:flavonoid glycosyltransferase YjiC (YdhE family)
VRILFTPLAWPTHYFPTVPTAWACRAAGHEVRVATQPALTDAVRRSGLIPMTIGREYDINTGLADNARELRTGDLRGERPKVEDLLKSPEGIRRIREARLQPHVKAAAGSIDDLLAIMRAWKPDIVVSDPVVMAAPLAARIAGVPLVRHLWGPDPTPRLGFPGWGLPVTEWPAGLLDLYERFDTEPAADVAEATIDPCPASMQSPGIANRRPVRYVPYNGTAESPEWLLSEVKAPRVCVTWGMSSSEFLTGRENFELPEVIRSVAEVGNEVIVAVSGGDKEALGEQQLDNVRVVQELPLQLVLPTCGAIVHHGGAGTTLSAAAYGVPQIVIAPVMSQIFNADQLAATGAGIALRAESSDTASITSALTEALGGGTMNGTMKEKALALQAEIAAQPPLSSIADELERTAGK